MSDQRFIEMHNPGALKIALEIILGAISSFLLFIILPRIYQLINSSWSSKIIAIFYVVLIVLSTMVYVEKIFGRYRFFVLSILSVIIYSLIIILINYLGFSSINAIFALFLVPSLAVYFVGKILYRYHGSFARALVLSILCLIVYSLIIQLTNYLGLKPT